MPDSQGNLSSTQITLSYTHSLLHTTSQKHLISKHVEAEKLQSEGRSLINVAVSTSDLSRLHDKLNRKRTMECKSMEVVEDFRGSFSVQQEALKQELSSALARHTQALNTEAEQHCKRVHECRSDVHCTSMALTTLGQRHVTLTNTTLDLMKKMVEVVGGRCAGG